MGSRIMQLVIGNRIAECLSVDEKDRTPFLVGSVAPDAVFSFEEKNLSHFFVGEIQDYSRHADINGFLRKYSLLVKNKDPYILGYFAHLVADDIWLRGFYFSWLRNRMDADEGLYQLYHNDFWLLNGKLLDYYGFTEKLRKKLNHFPSIVDLEELKSEDVEKFIPYVLSDMEYDQEVLKEKLNVFTFNQILGYVETSVDMGIKNIKRIFS
ncbi:hydrolase [Neobacillus notoginsengisoli]|uniref:Hydrolase n=1 Tax=Neobacillus notoginsengisoli TaxID=1578198 RepID=A0A417YZI6_9BACI|nr:hydrolase [Neobacillus notoginsengisoli]RHW43297.1 hydrolase [Neobacillus notoginsengisoli]